MRVCSDITGQNKTSEFDLLIFQYLVITSEERRFL